MGNQFLQITNGVQGALRIGVACLVIQAVCQSTGYALGVGGLQGWAQGGQGLAQRGGGFDQGRRGPVLAGDVLLQDARQFGELCEKWGSGLAAMELLSGLPGIDLLYEMATAPLPLVGQKATGEAESPEQTRPGDETNGGVAFHLILLFAICFGSVCGVMFNSWRHGR